MVFSLRLDEKTMTKRVLTERVSCNLCSSSKYKVILRGKDRLHCVDDVTYEVVKCTECGLVYTNPRPRFTEISVYYPRQYCEHGRYTPPGPLPNKITLLSRLGSTIKEIVLRDSYGYSHGDNGYFSRNHLQDISYFLNIKLIRKLIVIVFRTRVRRQFLLKAIPHFRKNGRLLDIGCGSGQYLYWMKQFGWDVAGVEISSVASERANELTLNVFCGQLSDAQL